jgi:iron complex outermembrane recepter protein
VRSIFNAAKATIKGVDAEFEFAPNAAPGLRIAGNVALLDATYDDFTVNFAALGAAGAAGQCQGGALSAALSCSFAGNRLPRSPKFQASLSARYKFDLGDTGSLEPGVQVSHFNTYFYTPNNNTPAGASSAYTNIDARLTWSPPKGNWQIGAWVKNLTDQRHITASILQNLGPSTVTGTPFPNGGVGYFGMVNDPRTYGVEIGVRF